MTSARTAALVESQGFRVRQTKKGFIAYAKDPALGTASWHGTPSCSRAEKNLIADLRKIGVEWP